jgi:hypothetical protein
MNNCRSVKSCFGSAPAIGATLVNAADWDIRHSIEALQYLGE